MSSPRHLWSGDWELDSAAARDELANRRAQVEEPTPEIPVAAPPPRARPSAAATAAPALARMLARAKGLRSLAADAQRALAARTARGRQLRIALAVAVVALLSAGAAFAVTTVLVGSNTISATTTAHAWLGIDVTGSPQGILVTTVVPGGPGSKAGLQPGDLLTSVNNQPVGTVDAVSGALVGLHSGSTIQIQFSRGPATYLTQATLATRPGSP